MGIGIGPEAGARRVDDLPGPTRPVVLARGAGRWWLVYVAVGVALMVAFLLTHQDGLFNLVGISSPVAILIGVRINKPAQRLPWLLFAAGQALFVAGDVVTYNYPLIFGTEIPFPSWGDPIYLAVYPCLVAGLLLVVRSRLPGRDVASLIDSAIIAIGAGTVSWVLLISPIATASNSSVLQKIVAMAYPILDLLLLAVVVRLVVAAGRRPPSLYLLAFAGFALLLTDGVYGYISAQGIVYDQAGYLEVGWAAFYLLWGAAALHGSMAGLTDRAPDVERPLSKRRLIALAAATLLAEVVHAIRDAAAGNVTEPFLYAVSILMFILVLVRLAGLVQREERSARRERTLREAGATLVAATDRQAVYRAAASAATTMSGSSSTAGVMSQVSGSEAFGMVVAGAHQEALAAPLPISPVLGARLMIETSVIVPLDWPAASDQPAPLDGAAARRPTQAPSVAVLLPLVVRAELRGVLVVALSRRPRTELVHGLETLAAQAALALERAEFAELLANQRSQEWFASLVQNASDVILVIEPDTLIRFVSPASHRVLGYRPDQLIGRPLSEFLNPDEQAPFHARLEVVLRGPDAKNDAMEFQIRHADGHWMDVETLPSNLLADASVKGIVLNVRDVSERKLFEAQLSHQAFYDALTGLANRALFQNRVEHAMAGRRRRGVMPSVLFMDLDDFKSVNDSLGHVVGDRLLASVAGRLQQCLRASDTAARLGGDEFAILVEDSAVGPTELATRVLTSLADPFEVDGTQVHVRVSIGIAAAVAGDRGPEAVASLLRNADIAMYSAKGEGGGR